MLRSPAAVGMRMLLSGGLRRSPWAVAAAVLAALVAAGALVAALTLLTGSQRLLQQGIAELGGELVLVLPADQPAVERWLATGLAEPISARIDVADWRQRIRQGKVVGIESIRPVDLSAGGAGQPAGKAASVLVLHLEFWASPMMAVAELGPALPEAAVVVGEQTTRQVVRDLQPLLHAIAVAALAALLAAVLVTGLLATIRVSERRGELGMLRAMGASRAFLIGLTLAETGLLALAGSVAGVALALGAGALTPTPAGLLHQLGLVELAGAAGASVGLTVLVAALAALGPALQAARLDPLDAVRRHGR